MQMNSLHRWSLVLALVGGLVASPADAQGKRKDKDPGQRERPELIRRGSSEAVQKELKEQRKRQDERLREERKVLEERRRTESRRDRDRRVVDDRWEYGEGRRDVPPGWCKGKGNPHNTPENCGYGATRRDSRYEPLYGERGGSYEREHDEFHRWHDRECRMRAAERPLDLQWQLRVRQECKERHDEWHYRTGRRHG